MTHVHDDPIWMKSSYSTLETNCVEVAFCACGKVQVRNSKDPEGPVLTFTAPEWIAFTLGAKADEFD